MILKIPYSELKSSGVKGVFDGKEVSFLLHVIVDSTNIEEALAKLDGVKSIICFEYVDEAPLIANLDLIKTPVVVIVQVSSLGVNFDFTVGKYPSSVRIIAELPDDFTDVRAVEDICLKYPHVRITGGRLLKIDGLRLGLHSREDIPKKIAASRVPTVWEGVKSYMRLVQYSELESVEYYDAKREVIKTAKEPKQPKSPRVKKPVVKKQKHKVLASLGDLKGSGFDNF